MTEWFRLTGAQQVTNNIIFPAILNALVESEDTRGKLLFIGKLRLLCRALGFNEALREEQLLTTVRLKNAPNTSPTFYQCVTRALRSEQCLAVIPNFTRHLLSRPYCYQHFRTKTRALPSTLRRLAEQYERQGEGYDPEHRTFKLVDLTRRAFNRRGQTRFQKLLWLWDQLRPKGFWFYLPFND
jgi:hypothetical protein